MSPNSAVNVSGAIKAKAALVGANTVNVASSFDNVVTKSAAVSAATKVEKLSGSASATSTIFTVGSIMSAGGSRTASIT